MWLDLQKSQYVISLTEDDLLAYSVSMIHVDAENFYPQFNKSFLSVVQKLFTETSFGNCISLPLSLKLKIICTAWKVSVFVVILVLISRISPYSVRMNYLTKAIIHENRLLYDDSNSDIFSEKDDFLIAGISWWFKEI